jgi:hypothetical protein
MQTTTKVLLIAGVLATTCVFHVFDINNPRVADAEAFLKANAQVLEATGGVKQAYLLPLARLDDGDSNRMLFYVVGRTANRTVQIAAQDSYTGRVQRYCVATRGCFESALD